MVTVHVFLKAVHFDGSHLRHTSFGGGALETMAQSAACVVMYMDMFFLPSKTDTLNM